MTIDTTMRTFLGLKILLLLLCQSHSAELNDEIVGLPGLSEPIFFRQYSGYLQAGSTRKLHYWFVESQNSPRDDPVLLWMNGGPGCSSMLGLLTELGPFRIDKGNGTLHLNPYSWNQVANVLFLEAPAGVGFSYDTSYPREYLCNDEQTADDNYIAILHFFAKFPELIRNDFYVTGESYAGVYVPTLVQRILTRDNNINLKGYAIGNGYLDERRLGNSLVFFGYYHGLWGSNLWTRLTQHCCNDSVSQQACLFHASSGPHCASAVEEATGITDGLNIYNLYDPCQDNNKQEMLQANRASEPASLITRHGRHLLRRTLGLSTRSSRGTLRQAPECVSDRDIANYLNQPEVKAAIHVQETPLTWTSCSDSVNTNYVWQHSTMLPILRALIDSGRLKTLIYNGDVDMACNFLGDEWFADSLGYAPTSGYKPWIVNSHVGGFFKTYQRNLTFVTVKGSGHMVPQDKPAEALHMIRNFLTDQPL
ncbi:lysosomal protective protein-like [Ornithodoros turicata]|uniref:lysosomal protective protein-like n=1 Tax=Ornithodoros turicata TaxID=34597 RepID=UPI00313922B2